MKKVNKEKKDLYSRAALIAVRYFLRVAKNEKASDDRRDHAADQLAWLCVGLRSDKAHAKMMIAVNANAIKARQLHDKRMADIKIGRKIERAGWSVARRLREHAPQRNKKDIAAAEAVRPAGKKSNWNELQ